MDNPYEAQRFIDEVDAEYWVATHLAMHLREANRFLDIGCGPGLIAAAVARQFPKLEVCGIESDAKCIDTARSNLSAYNRAGLVMAKAVALPFPDNSFDVVHSRMLIEYIPDKLCAVGEMARVCRPGGVVSLHGLDGQMSFRFPERPDLDAAVVQFMRAMAKTGFDSQIGRKLFNLAYRVGLQALRVNIAPYHLYAGGIPSQELDRWRLKLSIARPVIARALGADVAADALIVQFLNYLRREDTLTYSFMFSVEGRKRL